MSKFNEYPTTIAQENRANRQWARRKKNNTCNCGEQFDSDGECKECIAEWEKKNGEKW